jgi:hypothetical protein
MMSGRRTGSGDNNGNDSGEVANRRGRRNAEGWLSASRWMWSGQRGAGFTSGTRRASKWHMLGSVTVGQNLRLHGTYGMAVERLINAS